MSALMEMYIWSLLWTYCVIFLWLLEKSSLSYIMQNDLQRIRKRTCRLKDTIAQRITWKCESGRCLHRQWEEPRPEAEVRRWIQLEVMLSAEGCCMSASVPNTRQGLTDFILLQLSFIVCMWRNWGTKVLRNLTTVHRVRMQRDWVTEKLCLHPIRKCLGVK